MGDVMETIFLQFYREEAYLYGNDMMINFNNGLSYVWDKIKDKGRFVWKEVDDTTEIITEGKIYASIWYTKNLRLLYDWAQKYPNLDVYICGPMVLHYDLSIGKELPNFHIVKEDAEDVFCGGKTSTWNIEIPSIDRPVGYSVGLVKGYGCYWGRCRYCKITGALRYRNINRVPVINHPYKKYIWLHVYSMPPECISKLYPTLENRDDVYYATYIRGDKYSTRALKKVIPKLNVDPKYLGFNIGIEFPSNSRLEYMDKGATVEDHLEFIKVASDNDIRLHFNFILGWKNTTVDEVRDVESFLNNLEKISKPNTITANIYPLTIIEGRSMFTDYTADELEQFDTDYDIISAMPRLNDEQTKLNMEIKNLYHSFPFLKLHDHSKESWKEKSWGKK